VAATARARPIGPPRKKNPNTPANPAIRLVLFEAPPYFAAIDPANQSVARAKILVKPAKAVKMMLGSSVMKKYTPTPINEKSAPGIIGTILPIIPVIRRINASRIDSSMSQSKVSRFIFGRSTHVFEAQRTLQQYLQL